MESINVEICAACHPFFTGKSKLVDTAGRVDKYKERVARAAARQVPQKAPAKGKLVKAPVEKVAEQPSAEVEDKKHEE